MPMIIIHRWRMVIHGGIDGYSRTVVYLRYSDNNMAATVYHSFSEALLSYSVPSRVRADRGGKNVRVANYNAVSSTTGDWKRLIHN